MEKEGDEATGERKRIKGKHRTASDVFFVYEHQIKYNFKAMNAWYTPQHKRIIMEFFSVSTEHQIWSAFEIWEKWIKETHKVEMLCIAQIAQQCKKNDTEFQNFNIQTKKEGKRESDDNLLMLEIRFQLNTSSFPLNIFIFIFISFCNENKTIIACLIRKNTLATGQQNVSVCLPRKKILSQWVNKFRRTKTWC